MDEMWILEVFVQICFGLRHLHKTCIIHRDLKPIIYSWINTAHSRYGKSVHHMVAAQTRYTVHNTPCECICAVLWVP
jgi:hypothetical protein